MKTYENFISDLFVIKLPKEIIELGNILTKFVNNNIEKGWNAGSRIYNYRDLQNQYEYSRKQQKMYIYLDLNSIDGTYTYIKLDYVKHLNVLEIAVLSQPRVEKLVDIENFLEHILSSYANDSRPYITTMVEGARYWISLNKIPEIINKITQEEFDLYTTTNTYNL